MKFDFYTSSRSKKAQSIISISDFLNGIVDGKWQTLVHKIRATLGTPKFKAMKNGAPAVAVSGTFKERHKSISVDDRLIKHSGLICIDIDKKDNKDLRTGETIDRECLAQFISISGEGLKIIYKCKIVDTAEEHRRIYDACVQRLEKLGVNIKIDPVVKSIASLQYVSYDNNAYINWSTKLTIQPLAKIEKKVKEKVISDEVFDQLDDYVKTIGSIDVTGEYEDWLKMAFGLAHSLGENGRKYFHAFSKNYPKYSKAETDEKFSSVLDSNPTGTPTTISSVFKIIHEHLPKKKVVALVKKYGEPKHAVGIGEGTEVPELNNMVAFGLFLFKKKFDKSKELADLELHDINLNELDRYLNSCGYFRYKERFVKTENNIIDVVDVIDILHELTKAIELKGDYTFTYSDVVFNFRCEELLLLWRKIRAKQDIKNQIFISLKRYEDSIMKDDSDCSYIPYLNGVVKVNKVSIELIPHEKFGKMIWRERIIKRNFVKSKIKGHFERFFNNVLPEPMHKWYLGYMLHNRKMRSLSRAWLLYDKQSGNNGRTGKTIIGTAIGQIRNVVTVDGKTIDFKNRFYLQQVQPWTDILFIDDPSRYMSLNPLFNTITGKTMVDKKNKEPIELEDLKVMLASNWFVESEGKSESGRQFVSQLNRFYHSETSLTPIKDAHGGKEFFYEWQIKDWNEFDTFMMESLQFYFKEKAPEDKIIANVKITRFMQIHDKELYYGIVDFVKHNTIKMKDGRKALSQSLFVRLIMDSSELKQNGAGRTAREFITATTGCNDITISSNVAGQVGMFYVFDGEYKFAVD